MVAENNNSQIDQIVKRLARIANDLNCAIEIVHHIRKSAPGQQEITADDTRGGGAIVNAVRSCQLLNRMSKKEAEHARVPEDERFRYFRIDSGKQNLAPPEKAKWRRLVSETIPNGDEVQVVTQWQFPEISSGVTDEQIEIVRAVASEGLHRWHQQANGWIGHAVAARMGKPIRDKADRDDMKNLLETCRQRGVITVVNRPDSSRRAREFVIPGSAERAGGGLSNNAEGASDD